ncbi:MAG: hypothetical protein ACO2PN_23410 [Pyrobaculum sp.]|jgi:hypothetical protein
MLNEKQVIRKKAATKIVVQYREEEFEAAIPMHEICEFIKEHYNWKVGRQLLDNGDEIVVNDREVFNRIVVYVLLRKGRVNPKDASRVAFYLKSTEVEAISGNLFLRLWECKIYNTDELIRIEECRRIVNVYVNIAKAHIDLVS